VIARLHPLDNLPLHTDHLGGGVLRSGVTLPLAQRTKFAGCHMAGKFLARLAIRELTHAAVKHRPKNGSFILNGRALENMFVRVSGGLLRGLLRLLLMLVSLVTCLCNDTIRLMAELCRQFAVPP
jgi:hypothetical protein